MQLLWVRKQKLTRQERPLPARHPGRRPRRRRPRRPHPHPARRAAASTTYAVTLGATDAAGQAVDLATHQLALTLWTFLAFALDALAIAAQAITGRYLGAGDVAGTRAVTRRMVRWGVVRRRRHRAAAGRGQPVARARCSPPTPTCTTCWCRCCWSPRSASRSPGSSSSSTAC